MNPHSKKIIRFLSGGEIKNRFSLEIDLPLGQQFLKEDL